MNGTIDLQAESIYRGSLILVNREYGYRRRWYEDMSDITFEGEVFTSVRDYEEYLTFKFGNYLKLPPKEEQKIHHRISEFKIPEETEVRG